MPGRAESLPLAAPPLPPVELRRLVCHDDNLFALDDTGLAFPEIPAEYYDFVFDFGCGCGRVARRLMVQDRAVNRYLGIDIHRGMIEWCQNNLTPMAPKFEFQHHDVWNLGLGPENSRVPTQQFPANDGEFSLAIAHSVFTHLYKEQTEFYLAEMARILRPGGVARTTWFLFDKSTFPMMADFQVCLYINEIDPTNAVIYDWRWYASTVAKFGFAIDRVIAPTLQGHQWEIYLRKGAQMESPAFPNDDVTLGQLSGSGFDSSVVARVSAVATDSRPTEPAPPPVPSHGRKVVDIVKNGPTRLRFMSKMSREEFDRRVTEIDWWYHSYHFDNGFEVRGDYDIGGSISEYGFPESMEGLSVLDIGTGGGWFAHFFSQLGGAVTTVDARGYCDFDVYGRHEYPDIEQEGRSPDRWLDGKPVYYSPVSQGFWIMRDILGSNVRYVNSRANDVRPELFGGQKFDIVFLGAILCHLRDPIGALMAARSVCRGRVFASTPVVLGEPESDTMPRQYLPYTEEDHISWWLPNEACFRHWFLAAGFTDVDITRQTNLRADNIRFDNGRQTNGDQILRVGTAVVPQA